MLVNHHLSTMQVSCMPDLAATSLDTSTFGQLLYSSVSPVQARQPSVHRSHNVTGAAGVSHPPRAVLAQQMATLLTHIMQPADVNSGNAATEAT